MVHGWYAAEVGGAVSSRAKRKRERRAREAHVAMVARDFGGDMYAWYAAEFKRAWTWSPQKTVAR
jgi:hypothetical protein